MHEAASRLDGPNFLPGNSPGASLPDAMTSARRCVQLQQAVLSIGVCLLCTCPRPTPKESSPLADWILDEVVTPAVLSNLLAGLALLLVSGHVPYALSQASLISPIHLDSLASDACCNGSSLSHRRNDHSGQGQL